MEIYNEWTQKYEEVNLEVRTYPNHNIGLQLYSAEGPYATLTTNVLDLPKGEAAIDVNNFPQGIDFILKYKLGAPVEDKFIRSGYCTYPVFKLDIDRLKEVAAGGPEALEPWEEQDEQSS